MGNTATKVTDVQVSSVLSDLYYLLFYFASEESFFFRFTSALLLVCIRFPLAPLFFFFFCVSSIIS